MSDNGKYNLTKFSKEELQKLIDFIKNHEGLWNSSHSLYKNSEWRLSTWFQIASELNKSGT